MTPPRMTRPRATATRRPRRGASPAAPLPRAARRLRAAAAPPGTYTLERLDQVRVLAHPLRLRLLEFFAAEPHTTKQAAEALGENPTRLYHHVNALARVGLVALRSTRKNRGTTEKYYGAVARRVAVGSGVFGAAAAAAPGLEPPMVTTLLDTLRSELAAAARCEPAGSDSNRATLMRVVLEGDAAKLRSLRRRLLEYVEALARDCREDAAGAGRAGGSAAPRERWTMTLAVVPAPSPSGPARPRRR